MGSQLTLEYLLNVQDSLVTHTESVETQCDQLLDECRLLERENGAFEAEIVSLKKDIRLKQRTMATFEVMLLNASVAQRQTLAGRASLGGADKENAAVEANAIVDSLLGSAVSAEEGVVSQRTLWVDVLLHSDGWDAHTLLTCAMFRNTSGGLRPLWEEVPVGHVPHPPPAAQAPARQDEGEAEKAREGGQRSLGGVVVARIGA